MALIFKNKNGYLPIPEEGDLFTLKSLTDLVLDEEMRENYAEIALPVLRKLFAVLCIVKSLNNESCDF